MNENVACPKCNDTGWCTKQTSQGSVQTICDCRRRRKESHEKPHKCSLCHDTGWIARDDENGIGYAEKCECALDIAERKRVAGAQIPAKYDACDVESTFVIPAGIDDGMHREFQDVLFQVKNFADRFGTPGACIGLLLYGANGVGKTHLAVGTLKRLLAAGREGRFVNYQALLRLIKSGYDQAFGSSRTAEYDAIEQVDVLLLDDLGANRVTDWVEDSITELISRRHDYEHPTIVTTNYSPYPVPGAGGQHSLTDRIGERATSRLRDMCRIIPMPYSADQRGKHLSVHRAPSLVRPVGEVR